MIQSIINGRTITLEDSERQPCEIWDRIMGYWRPITIDAFQTMQWNPGKAGEFFERTRFNIGQTPQPFSSPEINEK